MGPPLDADLTYIFMSSSEKKKWLKYCSRGLKHAFYRRYIDQIFVLLSSIDHAEKLKEQLSFKHPNINFSLEKEKGGR